MPNLKNTGEVSIIKSTLLLLLINLTIISLSGCENHVTPPTVLIIGDSISIEYTKYLKSITGNEMIISHAGENCYSTEYGLKHLYKWMGSTNWQIIHFNFGMHDIKLDNNNTQTVPLNQYKVNLREIIRRMRAAQPHAILMWCNTTPVPDSIVSPPRYNKDVIAYNEAAYQIMTENNIYVNDLYSFALSEMPAIQIPLDVHFTSTGNKLLANQVHEKIRQIFFDNRIVINQPQQ
jgi:hypothetical protein